MRIDIHCNDFPLDDAIVNHIRVRLRFLLGRGFKQLQRVDVTLTNRNGRCGTIYKCCQITVSLDGLQSVVVEDLQPNLFMAIDRATSRASRTVKRRLVLDNTMRYTCCARSTASD